MDAPHARRTPPRRLQTTFLVLPTALLLLAAPAGAQDAGHPSPENNTLWAHPDPAPDRNHHILHTEAERSAGAPGAGPGPGTEHPGESWTWTMTLRPPINQTILLDRNTTIQVVAHIGADTDIGNIQVTTAVHHGDTLIARGEARSHAYTPSGPDILDMDDLVNEYAAVLWDLDIEHDRLPPGAELVWSVTTEGSFSAIHLGMDRSRGHSHLVLPILALQAPPQDEEEDGEEIITPAPGLVPLLLITMGLLAARRPRPKRRGAGA